MTRRDSFALWLGPDRGYDRDDKQGLYSMGLSREDGLTEQSRQRCLDGLTMERATLQGWVCILCYGIPQRPNCKPMISCNCLW
jgi:hypothetical protein